MIMMKKTLLHEVKDIEHEALALVAQAKEDVAQELAKIHTNVEAAKKTTELKAAQTAIAIIAERKRAAGEEAREITEQSRSIALQIHQAAEKNRSRALEKANILFRKEYDC